MSLVGGNAAKSHLNCVYLYLVVIIALMHSSTNAHQQCLYHKVHFHNFSDHKPWKISYTHPMANFEKWHTRANALKVSEHA